jgi:hypothetical protein
VFAGHWYIYIYIYIYIYVYRLSFDEIYLQTLRALLEYTAISLDILHFRIWTSFGTQEEFHKFHEFLRYLRAPVACSMTIYVLTDPHKMIVGRCTNHISHIMIYCNW